jgi:hypothetical protein
MLRLKLMILGLLGVALWLIEGSLAANLIGAVVVPIAMYALIFSGLEDGK